MQNLRELRPGQSAVLESVGGQGSFRRRLMEMGLLPGTPVRMVRGGGLSDLLELEVRGMFISLRSSDAAELRVRPN
jgi:ferrous iron transport protein A